MIRKLICPTDFSDAASNATEYSSKLAQVFGCELVFINVTRVNPVAAAVSVGDISANARSNAVFARDRLKQLADEVNKIFRISTDYEVNVSTKSLHSILAALDSSESMVVIGTNGADNMYQRLFGSNSYNVATSVNCPVLVIPEHAFYSPLKKIVFAWGYDLEENFSLGFLQEFRQAFQAELVFLHLSLKGIYTSREVYAALRSEVERLVGLDTHAQFDQAFSENVPETIGRFMKTSGSDLLVLNYSSKGPILEWFFTPAIRRLVETAQYPILVLPVETATSQENIRMFQNKKTQ